MKQEDAVDRLENRILALRQQESELRKRLGEAGQKVQADLTPRGILGVLVSGLAQNKTVIGEAASAAIGIGAKLVGNRIMRKPARGLLSGAAGIAMGFLSNLVLNRKKRVDDPKKS